MRRKRAPDKAVGATLSTVAGRPFFSYQASAVATAPNILLFDSGLGGLTVFREVVKARPDARYLYVADDAFFPYNGRGEAELVARVAALMCELIDTHAPDLVVIADVGLAVNGLLFVDQLLNLVQDRMGLVIIGGINEANKLWNA